MIIQVQSNQTLLDIAMKYLGDPGMAYVIAEMNELNVTDSLEGITSLELPDDISVGSVVKVLEKRMPGSRYDNYTVENMLMTESADYLITESGENILV